MRQSPKHGPDSSVFLVTSNADFAEEVAQKIPDHWARMTSNRTAFSRTVLTGSKGGIVIASNDEEAFAFINDYAAEHLAVLAENAWQYLPNIRHAGEILLGPHSAIGIANFVLGPSHVLPTGGAAKTASPLSVFDFMKRTSITSIAREAYELFAPHAEILGRYEGFDGHANSVSPLRLSAMI